MCRHARLGAGKQLSALETTVFQGTTLRGLLLQAYASGRSADAPLLGCDRVLRPGGADGRPGHRRHLARTADDEDKHLFATGALPAS